MELTVEKYVQWMTNFAQLITTHKQELNDLDDAIGDGDHGSNMVRGMDAVTAALEPAPATLTDALKKTAMALISKVGGASGPLYGTAFLEMAKKSAVTSDVGELLAAAAAGVMKRGGAQPGDKTMVDVWHVVVPQIQDDTLTEEAIQTAVEHTRDLVAHKGRASYLGERAKGHLDPGAVSTGYLFTSLLNVGVE